MDDVDVEGPISEQPEAELADVPGLQGADGRRRRRTALVVVGAALLAGGAGMWIGNEIQSPADRAAARRAPVPSLITVPVERRQLTSQITLQGEVAYNEPLTVTLAGAVGIGPGETSVVTEVREAGTEIAEGDMLIEVTTRPVFVLQGKVPMYRRLAVGTEGPDVLQLEEALVRLGYAPGTVDTVFDAATATAVEQMYTDAGYTAEGPSAEQRTELTNARDAVTSAERSLNDARTALREGAQALPQSQRLQLQQSIDSANAAVPAAEAAAQNARVEQDQMVAAARAARDTAITIRDAAIAVRDAARQPGAIDPDTGERYSAERLAALEVAAAEAQQAVVAAEGQLTIAEQNRTAAVAAADRAIDDAVTSREIARAQYNEATQPRDTATLQQGITIAEQQLASAQTNLVELEAAAGTRISPGEIVFAPVLPTTLSETYVTVGSALNGPIGMLATTDTLVRARVARTEAASVAVGASVEVDISDAGVTTTGTVLSVGEPETPATGNQNGGVAGPASGTGGSSGRMEVLVQPDPATDIGSYMFYGVRVNVPIAATDGEVLVVPVAALTVGPDETSQVEVERTPATDTEQAVTEVVAVQVGLSANGVAEVAPIDEGALSEGDRVVIGVDTHLLPGNAEGESDEGDDGAESSDESSAEGESDAGESDEGESDEGESDDGDGEEGSAPVSPLNELMGWVQDPVEQRRQQLEIEEQVSECMQELGWEYTPVDWSAQMPESDVDRSDPQAFGEKHGYGVMYNYETYELPGADGEAAGMGIEDPNQEYVGSLSESENQQYYEDLYGPPVTAPPMSEDGEDVVLSPPLDQQGCQGQARLDVVGEDPSSDPAVQELLNEYYEGQQNDAGLEQIVREWVDCLRPTLDELGVDTVPTDIYGGYQVMERLKYEEMGLEIVEVSSQAEADEYYSSGQNVVNGMTDQNGAGYIVLGPEGGGPNPELTGEQIDELTQTELELWKADQACQDEVGYAEYNRQREQELVDRLVAENPELG